MIVLGIETSCDETSVGIVSEGEVLSNIIASQQVHSAYGGVVPEVASREHERLLAYITDAALESAGKTLERVDGIAVTAGPGLMGSLLVGVSFGKGLALRNQLPLLPVNHIEAHLLANFIGNPALEYPFLCLLVSGGHTQIIRVEQYGEYAILGTTVDDAAGEAFDKVARLLDLGYPGGPYIDKYAREGDSQTFDFPRGMLDSGDLNFSFSGLKTAVLYAIKPLAPEERHSLRADFCASFQQAVVETLEAKLQMAIQQTGIRQVTIAGGVAANSQLRQRMHALGDDLAVEIFYPDFEYCTDNGAMIAFAGWLALQQNQIPQPYFTAQPRLSISSH